MSVDSGVAVVVRSWRAVVANNLYLPYTYAADTNFVHNCQTVHAMAQPCANLVFVFANYVLSNQGEIRAATANGYYDFVLRAGCTIGGVHVPILFAGQRDVTVPFGSWMASDVVPVHVSGGQMIDCRTRRVAVNATASSFNVLASHGAAAAFVEGTLKGTASSVDYTLGGEPFGATVSASIDGTGAITPALGAQGGLYTSGPSLAVLDPTGKGSGFSGYGNLTSRAVTSLTISAKGSNYSSRTVLGLAGGGGFGQATQAYGPCLVIGTPDSKCVSLQLKGNSITRGYGSTDQLGDEHRCFGVIERAFRGAYNLHSSAYVGNTLQAIASGNYPLTTGMVDGLLSPTHTFICDSTNDFAAATPAGLANVQGWIGQAIAREKAKGRKTLTSTTCPRTTSSDGFATVSNQVPVNAAFSAGGAVDQYDQWVLSGGSGADYVIDVRPATRDSTRTDRWRVDQGKPTSDGIHPLLLDWVASQLNVPALGV